MPATTGRPKGRPAKPVEAKRAAGNPGQRPLPDGPLPGEGLPSSGSVPDPPASLQKTGQAEWHQVWRAGRSWLSPDSDCNVVRMLCEVADEAELLREGLAQGQFERTYTLSNGAEVTHPIVTQLKELRTQRTTWLSMLGFSPSDRSRLGLGQVRVRDEMDDLEKRRADRAATA